MKFLVKKKVAIVILLTISTSFGQWQGLPNMFIQEVVNQESFEDFQGIGNTIVKQMKNFESSDSSKLRKRNNFGELITKGIADWIVPTANYANASEECLRDSNIYRDSLANLEGWALKMYDATGKIPDGILSYNLHAFGHFEQCLKIQHEQILGKYCTVFFQTRNALEGLVAKSEERHDTKGVFGLLRILTLFGPELEPVHEDSNGFYIPLTPSIAFCLPSSCSAEDIGSAVADKVSRHPYGDKQVIVAVDEDFCYTANFQERDFDAAAIIVIVLLSILGLFLLIGTAYDAWQRYQGNALGMTASCGTGNDILLSFSVVRNGEKILDTRQGADSLPCLHGIRFISMTWVVLGHVWMNMAFNINMNLPQAAKDSASWSMQVIGNATPSVDTFFFLSGLLVAYVMLKELDKRKGAFNPLMMYLHRYLRLTPVYAVLLAFFTTLAIYVGTGPLWQSVRLDTNDECRRNWWHHLLYINNFFPNDLYCMGETWYLANDMQMFLLAPFFVYALWKWPKTGLIILGAGTLFFLTVGMAMIGIENLPPSILFLRFDTNPDYNFNYYFQPWTRIPTYLVGIFLGYVLHQTKGKKVSLNSITVICGWVLAIAGGIYVIYGLHDYGNQKITSSIPLAFSVIYGGLHRTVFVACVGWVVFACTHGYGGFVNTLLSWNAFVPLSRLTYCTYLIHLSWLHLFYGRIRTAPYYTLLDQSYAFLGHLVFCMGLAFIVSTCVEAPFLNLEKRLFTPKKKSS